MRYSPGLMNAFVLNKPQGNLTILSVDRVAQQEVALSLINLLQKVAVHPLDLKELGVHRHYEAIEVEAHMLCLQYLDYQISCQLALEEQFWFLVLLVISLSNFRC